MVCGETNHGKTPVKLSKLIKYVKILNSMKYQGQ